MKQISTTLSMIVLLAGLASAAQAPLTVTLTRPADMDDATWTLRKQASRAPSSRARHATRAGFPAAPIPRKRFPTQFPEARFLTIT
ncbi:MAG: hypothetical protein COX66_03100 [Elusimicrobia bacterium CG_4_10_14_0_2_um_filter_63_34]|nr:MAG: hypothetical protein COX66_03100 [Elusimicrobia bacterium CG_4_10_14_0_2_um_filter_63_34]